MDSPTWAARAADVLPTGSSTGSKRPVALYGEHDLGPTHYSSAVGCRVTTEDDEEFIDCTMALGAVSIGYAEPQITQSVIEAIAGGAVCGLPHMLEVDVAERLSDVIPCGERVQFLKTGAEAMSAAVRLARTYTGREVVIGSGYFGWHDWCSSAEGVPQGVRALFHEVPFDDITALENAVAAAGSSLAAIVLEPVVERLPSLEWLARGRARWDANGAVLIFDEMKTGFRFAVGGYQQVSGVTPDLAAFGKAMANGYPLAAVCGNQTIMECARRTWISSTLASEASALAAASAVLRWHDEGGVCEELARIGGEIRQAVQGAIQASGLQGVTTAGLDQMWMLRFETPELESRFLTTAVRHGALFKRGAYNYAALAHDDDAIREIEAAASNTCVEIRDALAHDE